MNTIIHNNWWVNQYIPDIESQESSICVYNFVIFLTHIHTHILYIYMYHIVCLHMCTYLYMYITYISAAGFCCVCVTKSSGRRYFS